MTVVAGKGTVINDKGAGVAARSGCSSVLVAGAIPDATVLLPSRQGPPGS